MFGSVIRSAGVLGCLTIAVLAAGLAWTGGGAEGEDSAAVLSATGYSQALLHQLERSRAGEPSAIKDPAAAAAEMIRRAPLSEAPLALRGISAITAGDVPTADRAFSAAFSRNPRNVPARLWLANRAIETGEVDRAIELVSRLFAIVPEQGNAYTDAMAYMANLPGGVEGIQKQLGSGDAPPSWASTVVARINALAPDLDQLVSLNRITPSTQASFISRVISERGVAAGFLAWLNFAPQVSGETFQWPYDGTFEGKAGPPPFNWRSGGDLVEFAEGGGLNVSYLGRGQPVLLEQTMLLAPGKYTLASAISGDASAGGGGLGWAIVCDGVPRELGRVVMRELSPRAARITFDFEVPQTECSAQRLILRGEPGEFPTRARAEIASVGIVSAASGVEP